MSIMMGFFNKGATITPEINLQNQTIYHESNYTFAANVGYGLINTGQATRTEGSTTTNIFYQWQNPVGSLTASDYQWRSTHVSDSNYGGHGVWTNLSTSKHWQAQSGAGEADEVYTTVFDVEIRLAASPFTVLATARISLSYHYFGNL